MRTRSCFFNAYITGTDLRRKYDAHITVSEPIACPIMLGETLA
jgi:hypothetical protein